MMYFTYERYKYKVDNYIKTDSREENFQTLIIAPMLDSLLEDMKESELNITSTATHTRGASSDLIRRTVSNGKISSPDIVIAHRWNVEHVDNIELVCAVEVKSPCSYESLSTTNQIHHHLQNQIGWYLENFDRVMVTDCLHWIFIERNRSLNESTIISLINEDNEWAEELEWENLLKTIKSFLTKNKTK